MELVGLKQEGHYLLCPGLQRDKLSDRRDVESYRP